MVRKAEARDVQADELLLIDACPSRCPSCGSATIKVDHLGNERRFSVVVVKIKDIDGPKWVFSPHVCTECRGK